jgi:hypothetical protein
MNKKNLLHKNLAIVIATSVLFFVSCQGGNKPVSQEQTASDSTKMKDISQNVKEVIYPLPTPFETTRLLNNIGAGYKSAILNPVDKAEKYFTEKSKAVNLGVYGADLAYATTFDQKQDVKLYSKTLKTLVDDLGINIDYSKMLSDEFKEKINNKDSLINIITKTYYDSYKNLSSKGNEELAVMMVSGMWVELMYIATNISKDTYNNTEIVKIIAGQKESYNKLLNLLDTHSSNADIKDLHTKLMILKPVYDKVDQGLYKKDYLLILKTIQEVRKSFVS